MSQTPINFSLLDYQIFPGSSFGPYLNTSSTVDLTKTTKEEESEETKQTIDSLLKPILSPFKPQENQADVNLNLSPSTVSETLEGMEFPIDGPGLDPLLTLNEKIRFPRATDEYSELKRISDSPSDSSRSIYNKGPFLLDSRPSVLPDPNRGYQARKSSYVPYFQSTKSNTTGETPNYISISRPSSKSSFTSDAPPSYINKKSIEDPFDQSFGFISPNYISRDRKTQERIVPTSAPSYTAKNKRPKERTQPTQSPSYISKEYLKRASRY